ncbi:MAG: V-type ATP synthase subunit A [Anaerolineae bacterium]
MEVGKVVWISGPVVRARLTKPLQMLEQVEVSDMHLIGEVLSLRGSEATIQVYEETAGIKPGVPVFGTGGPLAVELGPGLIGRIFDGIQRPLEVLAEHSGAFIQRGFAVPPLSRDIKWPFSPQVSIGAVLAPGQIWGAVQETENLEHRLMLSPRQSGTVSWIAQKGNYTVDTPLLKLTTEHGEINCTMLQRWPVRQARPFRARLAPTEPLITGQRVIDILFPIAKGGSAAVPGGFGAGKTVLQHALAKWSDADIVVYIGCGERGNEMTDVLVQFPKLQDPRTGRSLMERTILVANTSNMPVAAREASIYTGITLAEYYRDMGYAVALMADSTSRWAEALREVSGRLEEMPAEEGFPAYLPSRLASFYERAGRVNTLNSSVGSVTVIGAVSPPSADFSEPVTQHTRRFVRVFWALDKNLAAARHFPSINWLESYSGYGDDVQTWWREHNVPDWQNLGARMMAIMQQESGLLEIAKLVGQDTLPDSERFVLLIARTIKEAFLQQNAMHPVDAYSSPAKQIAMVRLLLHLYDRGKKIIDNGCPIGRLQSEMDLWPELVRVRSTIPNDQPKQLDDLQARIDAKLDAISKDYGL